MRPKSGYLLLASLVVLLQCILASSAQSLDFDQISAREEFRWGVQAYHNGSYNDAILAFEQAAALAPDDALILEWLGHAYYRSGFPQTALRIWSRLEEREVAGSELLYLMDTVRYRSGVVSEPGSPDRYVVSETLSGRRETFTLFSRPASVFPSVDGGYYLTSFADNQVLELSANGALRRRILGGIEGIDRPFDVVRVDDRYLFISEFRGNRILRTNLQGGRILRFGEKGTGRGQLVGPQFLADDGNGYLYVSEIGTRRVSKWSYDGEFILSFGGPTDGFGGFVSPTGVVVYQDLVYVAEQRRGFVAVFDSSGNYLRTLGEGALIGPEGLSVYREGVLLVADTRRLALLDIETDAVTQLSAMDDEAVKLTKAMRDVNNNIVAVDFTANSLSLLTDISSLYTGLLSQITRVVSSDFPKVVVEVRVQDRDGRPLVGLESGNFMLTENSVPVPDITLIRPVESARFGISVLMDRSPQMENHEAGVRSAVAALFAEFRSLGELAVFASGPQPSLVSTSREDAQSFVAAAVRAGEFSSDWSFDTGLRLAASDLVTFPGNRAVVFVTAGTPGHRAFDAYELGVLRAYLQNNDITFHIVYTRQDPGGPDEFEYLSRETGGRSFYVFDPAGVAPLVESIRASVSGRYFLEYRSQSRTDFGTAFIRTGLEVLFFKRTGRGALGYFAPLEF